MPTNWEMNRLPRPALAAGSPDSRPAWALIQQAAGIKQQVYQDSGEINRGIFGEYGDCYRITSKSTIIYTSKIITFHKNTIIFIYIQILQFYSFCLFFEYCRKSHICKKHTFIKIAYFLKIIIIFIYPFFNILQKWGFRNIWDFVYMRKYPKFVVRHF